MSEHIVSRKVYISIFAALIVLTITTYYVAFMDLGRLNILVAMTIAVIKAALVILYFMHIRYGGRLLWIVVAASFFWFGIMIVLTLNDYLTRGWLVFPNRPPL